MTAGAPTESRMLKIAVVDESAARAAVLEEGLREAGYRNIVRIAERAGLLDKLYAIDPDVILIDLENPDRDVLEQMFQVSRAVRRPVGMFVDQSDASSIEAAIDAGVSAYVVDGLAKSRVKSILETMMVRHRAFARLREELEETRSELEQRKVVDRAKRLLMKEKSISEEQAYALLRKVAMNEKKKIAEIAQAVVTAAELWK